MISGPSALEAGALARRFSTFWYVGSALIGVKNLEDAQLQARALRVVLQRN